VRIAVVVGTRPEFLKTWSVIREINRRENIELVLIHTGQHYDFELSQVFFEELSIEAPSFYLEVGSHPPVRQTTTIMEKLATVLDTEDLDILLVQGDTNSCMGAALAAVLKGVPVGHIEAGCRSFDRTMPEEVNRLVIDSIAHLLFAPSDIALHNLLREGHTRDRAVLAGNTAVDVLEEGLRLVGTPQDSSDLPYAVATIHRAGNVDNKENLYQILKGFSSLPLRCILPLHPRTRKRADEFGFATLLTEGSLEIVEPMGYLSFLKLLQKAKLVLTDSGGVQEEAAMLGIPTLTIRENTEWPETIWSGLNQLVKADSNLIIEAATTKLKQEKTPVDLYQGDAGQRIVDVIINRHSKNQLVNTMPNMIETGYPLLGLISGTNRDSLVKFDEHGNPSEQEEVTHSTVIRNRMLDSDS
jgi:UDP-N-acetylglucosamine 2-epimerase (non-hydrolysing)